MWQCMQGWSVAVVCWHGSWGSQEATASRFWSSQADTKDAWIVESYLAVTWAWQQTAVCIALVAAALLPCHVLQKPSSSQARAQQRAPAC